MIICAAKPAPIRMTFFPEASSFRTDSETTLDSKRTPERRAPLRSISITNTDRGNPLPIGRIRIASQNRIVPDSMALVISHASLTPVYCHHPCRRLNLAKTARRINGRTTIAVSKARREGGEKSKRRNHAKTREPSTIRACRIEINQVRRCNNNIEKRIRRLVVIGESALN
jgi:hypothetical protein